MRSLLRYYSALKMVRAKCVRCPKALLQERSVHYFRVYFSFFSFFPGHILFSQKGFKASKKLRFGVKQIWRIFLVFIQNDLKSAQKGITGLRLIQQARRIHLMKSIFSKMEIDILLVNIINYKNLGFYQKDCEDRLILKKFRKLPNKVHSDIKPPRFCHLP